MREMVEPADREIIKGLRERLIQSVESALNGLSNVILLDAPTHRNAGDLLILQGS